jgi:signal transduction histidine kinase
VSDLRRFLPPPRTGRQWLTDAAAAACAGALGALLLLATLTDDPAIRDSLALQLALGAAATVLVLLYRRSRPVGLAVLLIPVGFVAPTAAGATVAVLFTTASARPARTAVTVAGVHALLVLVLFRIDSPSWHEYWQGVGTFLFMDAVALTSGMLLRSQRLLVGSLRDRARQAEEEHRLRVEEARHLERERIAREMHDVLAHRISLLAVHAGALEFAAGPHPAQARAAGIIRECAHEALEDLRDVIRMLRTADESGPGMPDGMTDNMTDGMTDRLANGASDGASDGGGARIAEGLPDAATTGGFAPRAADDSAVGTPHRAADGRDPGGMPAPGSPPGSRDADRPQPTLADLPRLVEETRRTGIPVAFDPGRTEAEEVPSRVGRHAYRIVQEGLTNARKHAPGEPVRVLVDVVSPGTLIVEIANSLHGQPGGLPPVAATRLPGAGVGLIGLRERVALVGGRLEHGHEQGEFRLRAWLPWTL